MLYYSFCIKMGRSENEFLHSSFRKVTKMVCIYNDEQLKLTAEMKNEQYVSKYFDNNEVVDVTSMNQIPGW